MVPMEVAAATYWCTSVSEWVNERLLRSSMGNHEGAGKHYRSAAHLPFRITVTIPKHEDKPGRQRLRTQPQVRQKHTESAQMPIALITLWAISGLRVSAGETAIMGVCVFAYQVTCG